MVLAAPGSATLRVCAEVAAQADTSSIDTRIQPITRLRIGETSFPRFKRARENRFCGALIFDECTPAWEGVQADFAELEL